MVSHIPRQRTRAPVELHREMDLFEALKDEIRAYYAPYLDNGQLEELNTRLKGATQDTTFARVQIETPQGPRYEGLINNFGGDDAYGLRYHIAHRFGILESDLPNPQKFDIKTYNLGNALHALRCAAKLE